MYVVWRLQSVWSPIAAGSGAGDVIAVSVFTLHTHDHAEFARHTGQQSSVATLFAQLSQKGACPHGSSVNPSHHATRHTSQQQWAGSSATAAAGSGAGEVVAVVGYKTVKRLLDSTLWNPLRHCPSLALFLHHCPLLQCPRLPLQHLPYLSTRAIWVPPLASHTGYKLTGVLTFLFWHLILRCRKARVPLAFLDIAQTWLLKDNFESLVTPRHFAESTASRVCPWIV